MHIHVKFMLMASLVLALAPGCSKGPEPAASAQEAVPQAIVATAHAEPPQLDSGDARTEAPEPVNPYDGIGDAHFRTMAERVDGLLVAATELGGKATTAIAAAEAKARAIIQLEQYRLELTTEGEGKLLEAADRIASLRPEGSLSRRFVDYKHHDFRRDEPNRVRFAPIQSAWEQADALLRSSLHAGRAVPRELRAAVASLDASAPTEFSEPALPNLETKVIRLDLHGDDLLPYLFHCYDVAENISWHRARDAQAHEMIGLFADPFERALILQRMFRLLLQVDEEHVPSLAELIQAAHDQGAVRHAPGVIELDTDELDRLFRIKDRFFRWVKPAEAELKRLWVVQDVGRGPLRDPSEILDENNKASLARLIKSPEWIAFMRDELTPFVHEKELRRMERLAAIATEADRAAIESLRQAQERLDDLQQLFKALVPRFQYAFRPVLTKSADGTAAVEPLTPVDLTGLDPTRYITGIHCEIRDGDQIHLWYTHSLDTPSDE